MKPITIAIIGAGLSGLATGIRLAAEGCRVKIFEKNDFPGGSLGTVAVNGFRFNRGAEMITAPFLFDQLFESVGKKRIDYFSLMELDPIFQAVFDNWQHVMWYRDPEETIARNDLLRGSDQKSFRIWMSESDSLFDELFFDYCIKPVDPSFFHARENYWFRRLDSQLSCANWAVRVFQNRELQKLFGFFPLLAGGDPRKASHLFKGIPQLFQRWGISTIPGGLEKIIQSLVSVFQEAGGELICHADVDGIQLFNRKASGVRLRDGSIHHADAVVAAAESATVCRELLDTDQTKVKTVEQVKAMKPGMGLFVYHFGTSCKLEERFPLAPLNVIFPEQYENFLSDVFDEMRLPRNPLIFLRVPSLFDSTAAPADCEAVTVMVPVPNQLSFQNWRQESFSFRNRLLNTVQPFFGKEIRSHLIAETHMTPRHFERELGCYAGAPFSFEPLFRKSGEIRLANRCQEIENLYFTGAGAHPGASIPGALLSAMITANLIREQ